jgi:hypothetical protein
VFVPQVLATVEPDPWPHAPAQFGLRLLRHIGLARSNLPRELDFLRDRLSTRGCLIVRVHRLACIEGV